MSAVPPSYKKRTQGVGFRDESKVQEGSAFFLNLDEDQQAADRSGMVSGQVRRGSGAPNSVLSDPRRGIFSGYSSSADLVGFPSTLLQINEHFAQWGASFSHAWLFEEESGNFQDLATTGPLELIPTGSVSRVVTGLPNGDRGIHYNLFNNNRVAPSSSSDLDISTGDMVILMTLKLNQDPGTLAVIYSKFGGGGVRWRLVALSGGGLRFDCNDGTNSGVSEISTNHADGSYHDVLCVLSRTGSPDEQVIVDDLGSGTVVTAPPLTLSNTAKALLGDDGGSGAAVIVTFLAWGTVPGTLITNRTQAVASWRQFRGAT